MRPLLNTIWYHFVRGSLKVLFKIFFRYRVSGVENLPATGATILISNHQSFLDPLLAAVACDRRLRALAKDTLFFWPLAPMIRALGAVPVDQKSAISGIRRTMEMLDNNEAVLIYPEGARTEDGILAPMLPGILLLIRRKKPQLAFVGLDGAYEAWPRHTMFPRSGRIAIHFGPTATAADYESLTDHQLLELIRMRLEECIAEAQELRQKKSLSPH